MFVLAHLSDLHVGPLPKPRLRELISKRVIGFMNWRRNRSLIHRAEVLESLMTDLRAQAPDHIAITGDLVNIALDAEFVPARALLARFGSPEHVTFVPGNHDLYVRATSTHHDVHWGEYMQADNPPEGTLAERHRFPFVRRRGPLALVGLSTAVPTMPFMATGRLGKDQLGRLSTVLRALDREGCFRVVLLHHPPSPKPGDRFKRLLDSRAFREVVAACGCELVLHGHDHIHQVNWIDTPRGGVPVVGVPSASSIAGEHGDPAAYNLYRIEGRPGHWSCEIVSRGIRPASDTVAEVARKKLIGQPTA